MVVLSASSALAPAAGRRDARQAVLARAREGLHGAGGGVGLRSRERGRVLPRLAGHGVARRRRLRRRGELRLPEEAAEAGGAARARRSAVGQPAPRHRRDRHRLRPPPVLLGARPLDPRRRSRTPIPRSTTPGTGSCSTTRSPTCATSATCAGSSRESAGSTRPRTRPTCSSSWPGTRASRPPIRQRLLDAAWAKMTAPGTPVFTHAEDERLAAALVSVVRRPDFDAARLDPWLARFVALEKQVWSKAPPDPPTLDASQNARNLLRSLYVLLSPPAPVPGGQAAADGAGRRPRGRRCSRPGRDPEVACIPRHRRSSRGIRDRSGPRIPRHGQRAPRTRRRPGSSE